MSDFIEEYDYLIGLDPSGIIIHDDEAAQNQRISEWFSTPQGTLLDLPAWGHNLAGLKHEPMSVNLSVMLEMSTMEKLPRDVRNVNIRAIAVEFIEIDFCRVKINYSLGVFNSEVTL